MSEMIPSVSLPVATFLLQCIVWPLAGLAYRSVKSAYRGINTNIGIISVDVAEAAKQLTLLNGRLGRLEQWRDDHQRIDDRAHLALEDIRRELTHRGALKAR